MVWKITDGGAVAPVGKMFSTKGVKIPSTWNSWTSDNKKIHGLYWEDDPVVETFDGRFYEAKDKEKSLTDVLVVDDDGGGLTYQFYKTILYSLGIKYSVWERINGPLTYEMVQNSPIIIWFTEYHFPNLDHDDMSDVCH